MIELRLLGTKCNIGCHYCYQNPLRDSGNGNSNYDLELVFNKLEDNNEPFVMWGGEPLLLDINDLERVLRFGFEKFGENNLLTNGVLITDRHIQLFHKFNVHLALSIDGPDELNDVRWAGTLSKTRALTKLANDNLRKLLKANLPVGLNIQVTKCNSSEERLTKMLKWLKQLDKLGLTSVRLHVLEVDYSKPLEIYAFDNQENIKAFSSYRQWEKSFKNIKFDLFENMKNLLLGVDEKSDCVWSACDAYTTEAVSGMDGQGRLNNCGNTDKEGINFQKPDVQGYERYIALYNVPDEYGGCNGCRFFLQCKGQCPGTAREGDWRNKSENCELFKFLFEEIEREIISEGKIPLSLNPNRVGWETKLLEYWKIGNNQSLFNLTK